MTGWDVVGVVFDPFCHHSHITLRLTPFGGHSVTIRASGEPGVVQD